MGRSNNQARRHAKANGKVFVPKQRKSKVYNQMRVMKIRALNSKPRKLAYSKVVSKAGKIKQRKFRSGGYNNSGKFGKAYGAKNIAKRKQ